MAWARLDDGANGNGKVLALSDSAFRMWAAGLIYCQANLTDGFIPEHAIETWGIKAKNKAAVAAELCRSQIPNRAPLWSVVESGFQVHDYLQWNDSRETVLKNRSETADRVARYRERQRCNGVTATVTEPVTSDVTPPVTTRERTGVVWSNKEELRPNHRRSGGVLDGSLPRDHVDHVACGPKLRWCIAPGLHAALSKDLSPKFDGDVFEAGQALLLWYPKVWATLPPDYVIGDQFRFWRPRFNAAFGSQDTPQPIGPPKPRRCKHAPTCATEADCTMRSNRELYAEVRA